MQISQFSNLTRLIHQRMFRNKLVKIERKLAVVDSLCEQIVGEESLKNNNINNNKKH